MPLSHFQQKLFEYVSSGASCVVVPTHEEDRCLVELEALMTMIPGRGGRLFKWTATRGTTQEYPPPAQGTVREALVPPRQLELAAAYRPKTLNTADTQATLYVFCDVHTWPIKESPVLNRALRDLVEDAASGQYTVIIIAPNWTPPNTIEKRTVVLPFDLPDEAALRRQIQVSETNFRERGGIQVPEYDVESVVRSLQGLTATEADSVLALSTAVYQKFHLPTLHEEKVRAVRRGGVLEILESVSIEQVGGLGRLKAWLTKRVNAFSPEARAFNLPMPRGILAVGPPGTGKSLLAKSVGTVLGVPVLRLDIGNLFGSLVGESEDRARQAIKLAESVAPCVLMLDEIDKGFAGTGSGDHSGDGGTTKRVFGTILTWLQEKVTNVFVVATANSVTGLPPELLRKGRFDELWFVDLPSPDERADIFSIHLRKRGRDPENFNLEALAEASDGFVGAEIEAAVGDALYDAFDEQRELVTEDIVRALKLTVPLSRTASASLDATRAWARDRARRASDDVALAEGIRRRSRNFIAQKLNTN